MSLVDENKPLCLYEQLLDISNKLEAVQSSLHSVMDFFSPLVVSLYSNLCDIYLRLLFEDEFNLGQFRRAEEYVWRRTYHDIYRLQKTKRQLMRKQDESLVEAHFISGIGFYSSLIIKLRFHYRIHCAQKLISPLNLNLGPIDNSSCDRRLNQDKNSTTESDKEVCDVDVAGRQWARQSIYRSLIYMGDLARYLSEMSQFNYRKLAFELYLSASEYQPDQGLPFNQLATLAGNINHNIDAVCNYMRSCVKKRPFEGAEGNMRKIFELNDRFFDDLKMEEHIIRISEVLSSKDPASTAEALMKTLIVTFIKLTSKLWTTLSVSPINIEQEDKETFNGAIEELNLFFEILREAIELEPVIPLAEPCKLKKSFMPIADRSNHTEKPKYVTPTIMYEFCSISIMLISKYKQQRQGIVNDSLVEDNVANLVNSLALNLLYYATSMCQKMIMGKVQELRVESSLLKEPAGPEPVMSYVYNQTYLTTIKIFFDLLLSETEIINSKVETFETFYTELENMVALLRDLLRMAGLETSPGFDCDDPIWSHTFDGPEWVQKFPLSCDVPLMRLSPLAGVQEMNINFDYDEKLTDAESGFLTIQCILAFSHALGAFLRLRQ